MHTILSIASSVELLVFLSFFFNLSPRNRNFIKMKINVNFIIFWSKMQNLYLNLIILFFIFATCEPKFYVFLFLKFVYF